MRYWNKMPGKQGRKYNKKKKEKYACDPEKKAWKIKRGKKSKRRNNKRKRKKI